MNYRTAIGPLAAVLLCGSALTPAHAEFFNRIATFNVIDNLPAGADPAEETVSEIIAATDDGNLLIYTDSPGKRVGMVDITDPAAPKAAGVVALDGEPTSVVVSGGRAMVGVVTSEDFTAPGGHVAVIDIAGKAVGETCDLGGQPDSLALSPDGAYLAVVIENERDEEVNDGAIPQMPSGNLTVIPLKDGAPDCAAKTVVDLTGIAEIAPTDAEPEYADVNGRNEAVVTLQENNHIAIVDLASGKVTADFTAGTVDLDGIDTEKDGVIALTGSATGVPREPDAVQWIDDDRFVTANEGDWNGGSRGFTIFNKDGTVAYDSGATLEHQVVRLGHYPEGRNKKGNEPEGAEIGTYGDDRLIFVGSERASLVMVYRDAGAEPEYLQALPGGVGPEGLLALPDRDLFVSASETNLREDGLTGAVVTIYRREAGDAPAYPTLVSGDDADGHPIGWSALSGAVADPATPGGVYAVSDSAVSQGRIYTIDTAATPAEITAVTTVTRDGAPVENLDLEGIAMAAGGGFWLVSEGNPGRKDGATANLLLKAGADGTVSEEIALPDTLAAQATASGFEGVTVSGTGAEETVWLAVQRPWKDDAEGMTKLLAYKPADKSWGAVNYPLEKAETGWVGLSEITAVDGGLVVIERDNQTGAAAKVKSLTFVSLDGVTPAPLGSGNLPTVEKTAIHDLMTELSAPGGYVLDKVESLAMDGKGGAIVITDNDGVDDSSGETQLIRIETLDLPQ